MAARSPAILIVDDEPLVCALIQEELLEHGYGAQAVSDPHRAKDAISRGHFDLVIADISMPDISGLELLAHARRHAPATKVILVSGASHREHVEQALVLGAFDYVEKPFRANEIAEAAQRALAGDSALRGLPQRAAVALEQSRTLRQASLESVRALVRAVEAKDPYTRRHSEQVAHYTAAFAKLLALPEAMAESIRTAALLHDVGKIGVPDNILTKPGPLTEEEFGCIRRHPALGADILAHITLFSTEAQFVRHHHERWDGLGYPDGLAAEESPLGARIIQLADCIDAMLMERTYKAGFPPQKMIGELIRCTGTQFDPQLAALAVQWCRRCPEEMILPGATAVTAGR
jgi:putative nucleotidyltransferase with HDIG domain